MANAKTLVVGGQPLNVIDDTARSNAQTALNNAEYNRQGQIGKYGGQSIATLLAGEIGGGTVYDALHKRIAANNFSGLRVGDYLDVPLVSASGVAGQQSVRFVIAHIDPYLWCDDRGKGHHIAFVASAPIAVSSSYAGVANSSYIPWNKTNTNQGTADVKNPYLCSQLKEWETAFEACLPEGLTKYLLTQRILLEERYSASGALTDSNNWSWQDIGKVWSLSEMEVYGCPVWGTPGYSVGFDCQFDLFKDTAHRLNGSRYYWWLRSVRGGSSAHVCYVNNNGYAYYNDAADGWVRPRVRLFMSRERSIALSGVPERLRNLSEREFYNAAIELRVEVLGIITSSAIPKSQRFTFAVPMAETARSVVYNIVKAEAFYPNTAENVAARKRFLTLAVADCEQLYQDAQAYLEVYRRKGDTQHAGAFERMAELIDSEIKLLKGARKGVKLIGARQNGRTSSLVNRYNWWLRSVRGGSSANVCYVNNNGNANYNDATNDWIRPRVGLLILARQPRRCAGLRAHEEGRADVRARARKDASRWEGSPLLAWPRASALDAVSLLLPKRPGNAGAHRRRPCGMPS